MNSIHYAGIGVPGVEAMEASTARSFPRHTHDYFGIGLVTSGRHTSWSGRGQVEAGPGEFICVNPGEVHDGSAVGGHPRTWRIFYLDPHVLRTFLDEINECSTREFEFAAPVFAQPDLRHAFNSAFAMVKLDAAERSEMDVQTCLFSVISRLTLHSSARRAILPPRGARIRHARQLIDDAPATPWSLTDLAGAAGVSRFQLIRAFARETGLTPHAYVTQRRLDIAKRLLKAGGGIAEIAVHCGFSDQSHLTRAFARQFGITPGRYRAQVR